MFLLHHRRRLQHTCSCTARPRREAVAGAGDSAVHFDAEVSFVPHWYHYTVNELEPHRGVGDPEMDDLLEWFASGGKTNGGDGYGPFDDLIAHAAEAYHEFHDMEASPHWCGSTPTTTNASPPGSTTIKSSMAWKCSWHTFPRRGVPSFTVRWSADFRSLPYCRIYVRCVIWC